jgi:hypothetical protein
MAVHPGTLPSAAARQTMATRAVPQILGLPVKANDLDTVQLGFIFSSFFAGYGLFSFLGGYACFTSLFVVRVTAKVSNSVADDHRPTPLNLSEAPKMTINLR